jgi:hypothetical protein
MSKGHLVKIKTELTVQTVDFFFPNSKFFYCTFDLYSVYFYFSHLNFFFR